MSTSDSELRSLAKYYKISLNAVVMKDQLKHYKPNKGNYIINLQSSNVGFGTHWVCMVIDDHDILHYDSFGGSETIEQDSFVASIRKGKRFAQNKWICQDLDSELCGYYVLGMFMYIKSHPSDNLLSVANDYINMFVDDTDKNGEILKNFYANYHIKPNNFIKTRLLPKNIK